MRRSVVLGIRVVAVVLLFPLAVEGPDLLLLAVLDAGRWLPVGLGTGVVTLPLLWTAGVGFAPPWTLPAYRSDASLPRVGCYHLVCCVVTAWLWTAPTLAVVTRVHRIRGGTVAAGTVPADVVSVTLGHLAAALLLFLPAVVVFVRLSTFQTGVDLRTVSATDAFRPALVGVGGTLAASVAVGVLATVVSRSVTLPFGG
jgi:hypothetical protein